MGACALLWTPSIFLNDEIVQAAGLRALASGHLFVPGELGPGYDALRADNVWHESLPPTPDSPSVPPVGSTLLNVLAVPVVHALRLLALPAGPALPLAALASLFVALGVHAGLSIAARPAGRRRAAWAALAGAACLVPALLVRPSYPADLFLDAAALQLVSLAATGVGAAYLFDLLRGFLPQRDALAVTLLGMWATPLFFWSTNAKYHALSAALLVLALWCLRDGHRSPPLRFGLAFALGGLAFWSQAPLGFTLLVALAALALPAVRLGLRPLAARAGAALAGLAVGLAPWVAESLLLAAAGGRPQFVSAANPAQGTGFLATAAWNDPLGALKSLLENLVWADVNDIQAPALAALCAAPFVVLAAWGWRRTPRPLAAFAAAYAATLFSFGGAALLNIGYGFDMRHMFTLWPLLVLLSAPGLSAALERRPAPWLARRFGWMLLAWGSACILLLALAHHAWDTLLTARIDFDLVLFNTYGGLALAILVAWFAFASRSEPRFFGQLDAHLAFAAAAALFLQVLLKLKLQFYIAEVQPSHAPYVIPWVDGISRFLGWLVYTQ